MNKVFIIAEAGVNHNGNLKTAFEMIDIAKNAGVDAIKFQTFTAEKLTCKNAAKAPYQKKLADQTETQYQMLKKYELNKEKHHLLINKCNSIELEFLSSPFDIPSICLLEELGLNTFKIPSGEITNYPYLKKIASLNKKVILSTGMSTMSEISDAIDVFLNFGTSKDNIVLMHCTTAYPTPITEVNLMAMKNIQKEFGFDIGYSDHTEGIDISIAAVALGAKIIEKHFTLDKSMPGPDHQASLSIEELHALVKSIRRIENAIGNGIKKPTKTELENITIARKSIVAAKNISVGEHFSEENLTTKRPGTGISPMKIISYFGKSSKNNYKPDDIISE